MIVSAVLIFRNETTRLGTVTEALPSGVHVAHGGKWGKQESSLPVLDWTDDLEKGRPTDMCNHQPNPANTPHGLLVIPRFSSVFFSVCAETPCIMDEQTPLTRTADDRLCL